MSSRKIPELVKKQVREYCGFGCAKCGSPVIDYHHIVPWAECKEHDPNNLMLLCPTCHRKIGKWSLEDQKEVRAKPKNIKDKKVNGLLYTPGRKLKFQFGGGYSENTPNLIMWQKAPGHPEEQVVGARQDEEGRVLMTLNFRRRNESSILKFVDNRFEIGLDIIKDFVFRENYVEYKSRNEEVHFTLDFRTDIGKFRGRFYTPRGMINVTEKHVLIEKNNNRLMDFKAIDCFNVCLLQG